MLELERLTDMIAVMLEVIVMLMIEMLDELPTTLLTDDRDSEVKSLRVTL